MTKGGGLDLQRLRPRAPAQQAYRRLLSILVSGLLVASLLLAVFVVVAVRYPNMQGFDHWVASGLQARANGWLTTTMLILTGLGSAFVQIVLSLVISSYLYFRRGRFWEPTLLVTTLTGAWALNQLLKLLFQRTRPDIYRLTQAWGYSFPSGHAMISLAFYGMLAYLLWLNLRTRSRQAWVPAVALVSLALLIGLSRIYLGVHYPSDVIGGFAAGGAWLLACITALRAIRCWRSDQ